MLTLTQFVDKWNGKVCDYDGFYGGQCVDLYRMYVQEVLGCPQGPGVLGAKDIWDSYLTEYYDRIPNTPDGFPLPGDIMIWGPRYGTYGHVAIVVSANQSSFTCFSQNDPSGALCVLKKYTAWSSLLGWLHPKPKDSMYKGYDLSNSESMKVAVDTLVDLQNGLLVRKEQVDQIISDGNQKLVDAATSYEKEKAILNTQISTLETALKNLQDTEHNWEDVADKIQRSFKAVLAEFAKVGVSLSTEMEQTLLASSVRDYLATYTELVSNNDLLSVSLLNAQETVDRLEKVISVLKKEYPVYKTVNFGSFIIKIYRK
jgi:hypothetical protein